MTTQTGRDAVLLSVYLQGRTCGDLVVGAAGGAVHKVNALVGIGYTTTVSECVPAA